LVLQQIQRASVSIPAEDVWVGWRLGVTELRRGRDVFQLLVERYEAMWCSAGYFVIELLKS